MFYKVYIVALTLAFSPFANVGAVCSRSYMIKKGDYCDEISREQGVSNRQLALNNPGFVTDGCTNLTVGDTICLGTAGKDCTITRTVQVGDTSQKIASESGVKLATLRTNNGLNAKYVIYVGQVLCTDKKVYEYSAGGAPIPASGAPIPASGAPIPASGAPIPASGAPISASGASISASRVPNPSSSAPSKSTAESGSSPSPPPTSTTGSSGSSSTFDAPTITFPSASLSASFQLPDITDSGSDSFDTNSITGTGTSTLSSSTSTSTTSKKSSSPPVAAITIPTLFFTVAALLLAIM